MKALLFIALMMIYSLAGATSHILLQDTKCIVLGSDFSEVQCREGSLITSICSKTGNQIICSNTTKGTMYGNKPSSIITYIEIIFDKDIAVWKSSSHEGMIIFDLKNRKYSTSFSFFLEKGLFNKNCIGDINSY